MHQNILREIARDLLACIRHELGELFLKSCFDVACLHENNCITMGFQIQFPCPISNDKVVRDSAIAYVSREISRRILLIEQPVRFLWPVKFTDSNHQVLKDPDAANLSLALIDKGDMPLAAVWVEYTPD